MTPEERQLLTTLADRVANTPPQQKDLEADQLLRQLVQERPDTVYILAQTVLMQDFALRNAQAQIDDLRRQLSEPPAPSERGSGSFLGGLFGGGNARDPQPRSSGSVPRVNPWSPPSQERPYGDAPPPPPPGAGYPSGPGGAVMQPSQTSGFLRNAASTAAGVAGGALLFQGISSLFSGHHGSLPGGGLSGLTTSASLSETTHGSDPAHVVEDQSHGVDHSQGDDGLAAYEDDDYDGFGGDDFA